MKNDTKTTTVKKENTPVVVPTAQDTKEVATTGPTAVGAAVEFDYSQDAGLGMEGTDKSSFAIPFIAILQGQSPQIETVEGAKPGLFINTVTNQLFKEMYVIPCAYQRRFLRWAPREEGGGYRGDYSPVDVELGKVEGAALNDEGRYMIGKDELKDTRNHFVLAQSATGGFQRALISLSSTQIKKSKRWMSQIQGIEMKDAKGKTFNPASFMFMYKLSTVKEENNKGSWYGLLVELVMMQHPTETVEHPSVKDMRVPRMVPRPVGDELYLLGKAFHQNVVKGEIEIAPPQDDLDVDGAPGKDGKF